MEKHIELLKKSEDFYTKYKDLPLAVYITCVDGILIEFNNTAGEILELTLKDKGVKNILTFYRNQRERKDVIERLKKIDKSSSWHSPHNLEFIVNGKHKFLKFYAYPYFDDVNNDFLGSLSIAFEVKAIERFLEIAKHIPIGTFEVDINKNIAFPNDKFKEITGISNATNLDSLNATDFIEEKKTFNLIVDELIRTNKPFLEKKIILKRGDDTPVMVDLTLFPEKTYDGRLLRTQAYLIDSTYDTILKDAPIGLYLVGKDKKGEEIILHSNDHYNNIVGFESEGKYKKLYLRKLFKSDYDYNKLKEELERIKKSGETLIEYPLSIINLKGKEREIVISTRYLQINGNQSLRVGVIYDITDDVKEKIKEWRQDMGSLFHSYSALLDSIRQTLMAIINAHDGDVVLKRRVIIDKSINKIEDYTSKLRVSLDTIYGLDEAKLHLTIGIKQQLERAFETLKKATEIKEPESRKLAIVTIRTCALSIRKFLKLLESKLNLKLFESAFYCITEILRHSRIISLDIAVNDIKGMELEIQQFKAAISADIQNPAGYIEKDKDVIQIIQILRDVIASFQEFAHSKKIKIQLEETVDESIVIVANYRELHQALSNVLHNAIKYSWTKSQDESWVSINVDLISKDKVQIVFKNRGVAIRKEELTENMIFRFGYRGAYSGDKERAGSGIGLWHAETILHKIGGSIKINSIPVVQTPKLDYSRPFITTVNIILPIFPNKYKIY